MLAALTHRGPDDSGVYARECVGLGMTRLAIIDLATGHQPMANEDESLWIVFNGEIYNHQELRPRLEARGHRFKTRSDTEAILHLYEEYAEGCVDHLRGMFALAIWDAKSRSLFLARDRMGKKPLYYWRHDDLFLFGSEIKALLCHSGVSRDLDWEAVHHYLAFGYTPADRSIFAGIRKLPPAHAATFAKGTLTLRRYWRLPDGATSPPEPPQEAAERIRHEVREAVRLRLESDVPIGVFLSGGVDSSAVVACMREVTNQRIATFSIGFGSATPTFDELPYARLVARRFETDHTEAVLEPRVAEILPAIARHFDEPFADSSAIPTFIVAQATAQHVKVALSGIGGDETLAGYPRYLGVRLSESYGRIPAPLRSLSNSLLHLVPESDGSRNLGSWARRFADGSLAPMPQRYIQWNRFYSDPALGALATPATRSLLHGDTEQAHRLAYAGLGHHDPMDGAFRIDLSTYLPDDLLVMADRMSMAHSLELRAPFCDHRVVEASLGIPPAVKLPGFHLKDLLKRAFADRLPREVLTHRKQGFMVPMARWLRTDLRPLLDECLGPDRIRRRGLFEPAEVERLVQEHSRGIRSHADRLWALIMLELWMRERLDTQAPWRLE
jgi:asparagine synthase (glutamine-hydrolysing)